MYVCIYFYYIYFGSCLNFLVIWQPLCRYYCYLSILDLGLPGVTGIAHPSSLKAASCHLQAAIIFIGTTAQQAVTLSSVRISSVPSTRGSSLSVRADWIRLGWKLIPLSSLLGQTSRFSARQMRLGHVWVPKASS